MEEDRFASLKAKGIIFSLIFHQNISIVQTNTEVQLI
jgi:hypothetical protein